MARPIPNDRNLVSTPTFGDGTVVATLGGIAVRPFAGNAPTGTTSTSISIDSVSSAPHGALELNVVGAPFASAAASSEGVIRKIGLGALGRRYPARQGRVGR